MADRSSLLVIDSISTSARVSSKTFIKPPVGEESEREEKNRRMHAAFIPIALHPPEKRVTVSWY